MTGARVIAVPTFDTARRIDVEAPAGSTVGEIVALALPGASPALFDHVRVTIGNAVVPRQWWASARPKPGSVVLVRVMPGNSGVLRTALSIAVSVAAIALGQVWAPALAGSAFGTALGLTNATAGALISGATMLAGQFLLNAFVPLRPDQSKSGFLDSPTYGVQGFKNVANPDGMIPCPMGRIRFAPPYAALPYTEIVNGETFVIALFLLGYGPLEIRNMRFGDTPVERYKEVQIETRQGYVTDERVTLYPQQVLEQRLTVDLNKVYSDQFGSHTRFTASDVTESSIDVTFPSGMFQMHTQTSGNSSKTYPVPFFVEFRIRQRLNGVGAWSEVTVWRVFEFKQKAFTASFRWTHPSRGRWEVEVTRLTPDFDDLSSWSTTDQIASQSIWSVLRSFRPEYPIAFDKPLALVAIRARGTKQLNTIIDDFNLEVGRICLDYDSGTSTWVERETRNPASLYRYAMQGPMNAYPLGDDEIDLTFLQNDFHPFCVTNNLYYDRVHDFEASVYDVMSDICAAGRAAPRDDGEKWGAVIDRPQTITFAHLTPRNSFDLTGERTYVDLTEGFRVKFPDASNDYKQAERIIPWPGFVGTPSIVESIDLPGICEPDNVWLEARKRQYELIYRRDVLTLMQDVEGSFVARGDMCHLSHPTLRKTQHAVYAKAVNGNVVVIDDVVTMETGKNYTIRIRKLATNDVDEDQSVLRTVQTIAGEVDALFLTGSGVAPAPGDLIMFGEAGTTSETVLVKEVEATEDMGARHTLIPYAPEIFELLAAEVPPAWNGRAGGEADDPTVAPGEPTIGLIISGEDVTPTALVYNVFVPIEIDPIGPITDRIELQHRILGAPSWTTITAPVGGVLIEGYADLDEIEVRARAIGVGATPLASAWTDSIWHVVAFSNEVTRDFTTINGVADKVIDLGSFTQPDWQTVDASL